MGGVAARPRPFSVTLQKDAFRLRPAFLMAHMMRRLAAILFCVLLLALVWLRSPVVPANYGGQITLRPLAVAQLPSPGPGMVLERAWQLESTDEHFGGYSALLALEGGRFLAISDRGRDLAFLDPSIGAPGVAFQARMGWFATHDGFAKRMFDAESVTRDPVTRAIWVAYEQDNRILRIDGDGSIRAANPPAMRQWPSNSGPEAFVRLADGRFIVLAEHRARWWGRGGPGLLFPRDPLAGEPPLRFTFVAPDDYVPVDMAQLPDGRVLVLLRALLYRVPPRFSGALLLLDPEEIRRGAVWSGQIVARFDPPLPSDNYEGLAIAPGRDGDVTLWIISDDNVAVTQRTLLLKLRWMPPQLGSRTKEKAHRRGGTP